MTSRTILRGVNLESIKKLTEAELGQANKEQIGEHAPGSLKAKSVTVDGTPHRWRISIEWEPI